MHLETINECVIALTLWCSTHVQVYQCNYLENLVLLIPLDVAGSDLPSLPAPFLSTIR